MTNITSRSCCVLIGVLAVATAPLGTATGDEMPRGRIQGHVIDEDGQPIADARFTTYPRFPVDVPQTTLTGDDGSFTFDLPNLVEKTISPELDRVFGAVHKAGYAITGFDSGQTPIPVLLRRPDTITFTIIDPDGKPIVGARVEPGVIHSSDAIMRYPPPESWSDDIALTTNAEGQVTMRSVLRHSLMSVVVSSPAWGTQRFSLPRVGAAAKVVPIRLGLQSAGVVRGRLSNSDRKPIVGQRVTAMAPARGDGQQFGHAVTDASGRFELKLRTGQYQLFSTKEDFTAGPLTLTVTDEEPVDIELCQIPTLQVYGRVVTEGGRPAGQVPLSFWTETSRKIIATDLDGRFESPLAKGTWNYLCFVDEVPGYLPRNNYEPLKVEVSGADDIELPVLTVETGKIVDGVIQGIDTSKIRIRALIVQIGMRRCWCTYDKRGRFRLTIPRSASVEELENFEIRFVDGPIQIVSRTPLVLQVSQDKDDPNR